MAIDNTTRMTLFRDGVDLAVHNATVVTVDSKNRVLEQATVLVSGGRIVGIGADADLTDVHARHRHDAAGKVLVPGLVNAHCHAADSLFRGLVEDLPLEPWLEQIWRAEGAILDDKTALTGSLLGLSELLLSGVTTALDMFFFPFASAQAGKQLGMRVATGTVVFDDIALGQSRVEDIAGFFEGYPKRAHIIPGAMAHGAYTVKPSHIRAAFDATAEHNGFFHIHCAETAEERRIVTDRYGCPVVEHLARTGVLSERTSLAHCVHVDDQEIATIARSGSSVVHNPVSNLKLGSGFAPISKFQAAGVNIALGTDGGLSGNDLDMFLAMRLASTLPRATSGKAAAVTSTQALRMGTINGAKALGLGADIGSIELGKFADFFLLDVSAPHATPLINPVAHVVNGAGRADVTDVFVAGKQVVASRRIVASDIAPVLAEVRALKTSIVASIR